MSVLVHIVLVLFVWFVVFEVVRSPRLGLRQGIAARCQARIVKAEASIEALVDEFQTFTDWTREEAAEEAAPLLAYKIDMLTIEWNRLVFAIVRDDEGAGA